MSIFPRVLVLILLLWNTPASSSIPTFFSTEMSVETSSSGQPENFGAAIAISSLGLFVGAPNNSVPPSQFGVGQGYSYISTPPNFITPRIIGSGAQFDYGLFGHYVAAGATKAYASGLLEVTDLDTGESFFPSSTTDQIRSICLTEPVLIMGRVKEDSSSAWIEMYNSDLSPSSTPIASSNPTGSSSSFAISAAISQNFVLAIGDSGTSGTGGVFVYGNVRNNFSTPIKLQSPSGGISVGKSIAITTNGMMIVAGGTESAWVYDNSTGWANAQAVSLHTLVSSQLSANSLFGFSVGISGSNIIAVGAPGDGVVYLFQKINSTWTPYVIFNHTDGKKFGSSISIYQTYIGIGCTECDYHGEVYISPLECTGDTYGITCAPTLCVNGTPSAGLTGTGLCTSCVASYYNQYCNGTCNCINSGEECDEGLTGTGNCYFCGDVKFGNRCESTCDCNYPHGSCDTGLKGTGVCLNCSAGYAGSNCANVCPQTCLNNNCFDGIDGNATCRECPENKYGPNCINCTCQNGECSDGISGTGMCNSCLSGFYGANCDGECDPCLNGTCIEDVNGNGTCSCPSGTSYNSSACVLIPVPPEPAPPGGTEEALGLIPGLNALNGLIVVIVVPAGGTILIIVLVIIIVCCCCKGKGRTFDSDDEKKQDSVSM